MPYKDSSKKKENREKHLEDLKKHAYESIKFGEIIDRCKWDVWCNEIKRSVNNKKHAYPDDFTNDIIFELMKQGCFYCGDIAITIDRIDSNIGHTPGNCVGCCRGCNYAKGAADLATFIRKAYYRAREKYIDGIDDIWFVHKEKPRWDMYKKRAENKGVPFDLSMEYWDALIKQECEYCKRRPTTWFGVDRVIPRCGYVVGNTVSCCFDCNIDKHDNDVCTTKTRNEMISVRLDTGKLVINSCDKVIIHCGTNKTIKKVCAYGTIYMSKRDASRALGMNNNYVSWCINNGKYPDDIFEIS